MTLKTWPLLQLTVIIKILIVNTLHFGYGYFRNVAGSLVRNVVCMSIIKKKKKTRVFDIISGKLNEVETTHRNGTALHSVLIIHLWLLNDLFAHYNEYIINNPGF